MDLGLPGRAARPMGRHVIAGLLRTAAGAPLTFISILTRARPSAAGCAGDRCRRFLFGESRSRLEPGMDLGLPGRAARPMGSPRDRRAVAHSGWGPVDLYLYSYAREALRRWLRRRPLSPIFFWRIPEPAGAGDGPRAAGASGQTYGVAT